jgi:ActR/RegA family two-component response regulator
MFPKDAILSASTFVGKILLVSNDATAIEQLTDSLQKLALFWELRSEVSSALERLNRAKFEAVIVDLRLGRQAVVLLEEIRRSASNKNAKRWYRKALPLRRYGSRAPAVRVDLV